MNDKVLRSQLIAQLEGGQAYTPVAEILKGFPIQHAGARIGTIAHTPWELLEHLRISQWDILYFTIDPNHVTPPWPDEHWPHQSAPADASAWNASAANFLDQLDGVKTLARDPAIPLLDAIPHGSGQTYLREILLVADHNAHHLGQLLMLRRALEALEGQTTL